jgi:putative endonuclease
MHYLYILYAETSDIYYVGQSHDPWKRFEHHSTDENDTFTSKQRPWEIKAVFEVVTRSDALRIEMFIKKQKPRKLIEMLVQPDFVMVSGSSPEGGAKYERRNKRERFLRFFYVELERPLRSCFCSERESK